MATKRTNKSLNDKFSIETPIETLPETPPPAPIVAVTPVDEIDSDTLKARTTLNSLIDTSMQALEDLVKIAKASEEPRAYEVVAQMIKATADTSKDLLKIQKDRQDLRPNDDEGSKKTSIGTQQNIFVGSTNDLMRALASMKQLPDPNIADAIIEEISG